MNDREPSVVVALPGAPESRVRGRRANGVVTFAGIPYAESPIGPLRFAPPVRRRPWSGILDRTRPAPGAPQRPSSLARLIGMSCPEQDDDCLHVTVWTPSCAPDARRPVLFWIHGGGFESGSTSNPLADGSRLAARGDVVVVSVGYRLGVLGFLPLEGVPSNRGLLDQALALEWVKENIRAFGGDPDNVTIFGSSAGGTSVAALLATHGRSGLFRRAIVQSGTAESVGTEEVARAARRELLVRLRTDARRPAEIRQVLESLPTPRLLDAQAAVSEYLWQQGVVVPVFQLALDAATLPRVPLAAIHDGSARDVDLFVGTNKDELRLWSLGEDPPRITSADDFAGKVAEFLGGPFLAGEMRERVDRAARKITARYVAQKPTASFTDRFFDLVTDAHFRMPALRLASAQARHRSGKVYSYLFAWQVPIFRGTLGAPHAVEIPFLFGTHARPRMAFFLGVGDELARLGERMQDVWSAFARSGDPSTPALAWPEFRPAERATGVLDRELSVLDPAWAEESEAWSEVWHDLYAVEGIDTPTHGPRPMSIPPPQLQIEEPVSRRPRRGDLTVEDYAPGSSLPPGLRPVVGESLAALADSVDGDLG